jgi:hypothetical protein
LEEEIQKEEEEKIMAATIKKTTKGKGANYRPTKSGAGMTKKGVAAYRRANPGSKLKTAVTGKVKRVVRPLKEESLIVLEVKVK